MNNHQYGDIESMTMQPEVSAARFTQDAILCSTPAERQMLDRNLKQAGRDKEIIAISPGMSLIGRRFRNVFFPASVYYRLDMSAPRFEEWFNQSVRCRLDRDGQIIMIP